MCNRTNTLFCTLRTFLRHFSVCAFDPSHFFFSLLFLCEPSEFLFWMKFFSCSFFCRTLVSFVFPPHILFNVVFILISPLPSPLDFLPVSPATFQASVRGPLVIGGLLKYENKVSVLNFSVMKHPSYPDAVQSKVRVSERSVTLLVGFFAICLPSPIPSSPLLSSLFFSLPFSSAFPFPTHLPFSCTQEPLIFHCGFRRYQANPVFSEHNTKGDKHKYEKFMHTQRSLVATVYAPITFPAVPLLVFTPSQLSLHLHAPTANIANPHTTHSDTSSTTAAATGPVSTPAVPEALLPPSPFLVATGALLNVDPDRIILKKIILTGMFIQSSPLLALSLPLASSLFSPSLFFSPLSLFSSR